MICKLFGIFNYNNSLLWDRAGEREREREREREKEHVV